VFLAKSKDGDYHQEINSVVFLEWFENQLMPALKNPSLVVLDNASYHNVKTEDTVCQNFSEKKVVLQNYFTQGMLYSFFCLFYRLIPSVYHKTLSKYTPKISFKMRFFYMSRAKYVHFQVCKLPN
jgi:hypothetical protein